MKRFSVLLLTLVFLFTFTIFTTNAFSAVKVGDEVLEKTSTPHPYEGGKGVSWQKTYTWGNAGYIALHFSNFDLAVGDYVEVSSPDGMYSYKYEQKGKWVRLKGDKDFKQVSEFWATHIPGDTAVVKLVSKNRKSSYGFEVDKWVHGYEKEYIDAIMGGLEEDADANLEATCSSDDKLEAKCYEGTEMYNKAKAVCRLLIGGSSACTGWLVGDEGHIMTNNHCISTQSDAGNTDYEFMAEGANCSTSCRSWGACPGNVVTSSGTMIKTDVDLDYTLILLSVNVSGTYGYMQLRDTVPSIGERIYIPQHPSAHGKQLAVTVDGGANATIYSTTEAPCMGGPGDIGYYADTEGGSSGSPVLGYSDHKVVALHHCANCPNRGVPIPNIIADLGNDLPNGATGPVIPQAPVADFSGDPTTVMQGTTVQFTDGSSHIPTTWSWSFPGGTPAASTDQNPVVTYSTLGSYDVSLTVTNGLGGDSITKPGYITVTDVPPYCDSQGTNQSDEFIGRVQIGNLDNTSGATGYSDFTNLTANLTAGSTVNVTLTPTWTGTLYSEVFTIWIDYNYDGDFTDADEAVFTGSTASGSLTGSFTVKAGIDVTTRMRVSMKYSSAATPCETFTYGEVEDYTAVITSGGGNVDPNAAFTYNATDLAVTFTDASTDSDGTIASWAWNFGDGNTSTAENPAHTYAAAGTYTVTLTVTDNDGASDTTTQDVTVTAGQGPEITLSGNGYKTKGVKITDLTWSGAVGTNVNIYRDGALVATTANDGAYTDNTGSKGGGTFVYRVCETDGSVCSDDITVSY